MTSASPKTRRKFPRIVSSAFEHPADRAALDAVKRIPVIDKLFSKFLELGIEKAFRIQLIGQAIHVTPKQCPKIYKLFKEAADILDMHEPDLFLSSAPSPNAFTFGVERPFIVINSSLVDLLEEDELQAVLGHELGHVKAGHVLYRSIAHILAHLLQQFLALGQVAKLGLAVALADWSRKSELTADRAELLVTQDVDVCLRLHMKLASGSKTVFDQIDHNEFLKQADAYEDLEYSTLNKIHKFMQELWLSHPVPVARAKEIKAWSESKQYKEIIAGRYPTGEPGIELRSCPHCSSKISPSFFFCPDCGKNARI
ncbi:MAG: M48 family metallopeptidase [Candidatus Obscuribacterales bacterium]|nr:M48 family metallopeptidase [Candidatus Obscuribacterales bacterium]